MTSLYRANAGRQPWKMLGWLLLIQILVAFVGRSLAPLGVVIGADLSLTKAQIGLLPAALFLGQSLVSMPAGLLADKIGSRKLLMLLAVCLGASFFFMTFTSSLIPLLAVVVIGGIGYGASHPATNRGIMFWFPADKRGTAMGIKQMGVTFGSAMAALVLLPLAGYWGWRPAVLMASVILLAAGVLTYFSYKEPEEKKANLSTKKKNNTLLNFKNLLKNKPLVFVSVSALILSGSQMILNTYLVLFSYERLGISLFLSGTLLVISEVGGSFGRISWGVISDRLFKGERIVVLFIISLLAACVSVLVAFLPASTSYWMMIPIAFLFGFSISGFNGIWMNATTELVPPDQSGLATGFSITVGSWGVMIGPPLFGLILDMTGSFRMGWLFVTSIMMIVMFLLFSVMSLLQKKRNMQAGLFLKKFK
ncbi:MFS transporter [Siminovitchia acidinfaciens]|uniref:MFS transporter n=1 Tax=Siminovitchia acidinfaciens TaxID=2321395 RepID=A0A429Y7S6_9BACI|nr:MFS transporter [Siminovitchia acidinfaciens]RST77374.1 MFS transporter [Siminovitchia acidinfaciens]